MKSSSAGELIRGLVWKPIRSAAVESSEQWRRVLTTGRLAAGDARDTSSSNEGSSFVGRAHHSFIKSYYKVLRLYGLSIVLAPSPAGVLSLHSRQPAATPRFRARLMANLSAFELIP